MAEKPPVTIFPFILMVPYWSITIHLSICSHPPALLLLCVASSTITFLHTDDVTRTLGSKDLSCCCGCRLLRLDSTAKPRSSTLANAIVIMYKRTDKAKHLWDIGFERTQNCVCICTYKQFVHVTNYLDNTRRICPHGLALFSSRAPLQSRI